MSELVHWKDYINRYPELGINTREEVRRHYQQFGKNEGRIVKFRLNYIVGWFNDDNFVYRFGNILFFSYIVSYIAELNNLPIIYEQYDKIEKLFAIHCPLCGTTKSFEYFLNGDYYLSFRSSVVGIPFIIYLFSYQILLFFKKLNAIIKIEKILTFLLFINFIKQFLWQ